MKWSLKIATVAGIGIFVHWTFLILLAWVGGSRLLAGNSAMEAFLEVAFVIAVFACVVLHELGHALAARQFGIRTRDITLLPIGGIARLERMPEKPLQELWVAVAGPLVNVVIAAGMFVVMVVRTGSGAELGSDFFAGGLIERLFKINVALVIFNMIPAFPMDGGRVLRAALATAMPYARATRIAAGVGQAAAIGFAILGFFFNPFLIFIALFVFLGAQAEADAAEQRSSLTGLRVRDAMVTKFRALVEDDTVRAAADELLAGSQTDFPVMSDGKVVGVLPRLELLRAIAQRGLTARVGDVMRRDCAVIGDAEGLDDAVQKMQMNTCPLLPVLREGQLVGLLTPENVTELVAIRSALDRGEAKRA